MRSLNSNYIGEIEPELIKESISHEDAQLFIQMVFDPAPSGKFRHVMKG